MIIKGRVRRLLRIFLLFFNFTGKKERIKIARGGKILANETEIGFGTNINGAILIKGTAKASLGKYCAIGHGVTFITSNHSYTDVNLNLALSQRIGFHSKLDEGKKGISIGNNVWIGDGVIILPGVSVGNGAVLAAGSVITKSVEPYAIVAGSPARKIKFRFDQDKISRIEISRWWELEEKEILSAIEKIEGKARSV